MKSIKDNLVYQWIKKFSNTPIEKNKNIKEILNYRRISLWWFIESLIFSFAYYSFAVTKYKENYSYLRYAIIFGGPIIESIFGKTINFFNKPKESYNKNNTKKSVLFVGYSMDWRANSDPKIKIPKKDIQLGDIIENLKNKENIRLIALQSNASKLQDINVLFEKTKYQKGLWKPSEIYLSPEIIIKTFKAIKHFDGVWNTLKNNQKFIDLLKFSDSKDVRNILNAFNLCFQYYIPKSLLYIEIMKKAIEIEKPDVIVVTSEYDIGGIAPLIAGKMMNVPVLAIQHGITGPFHQGYIYTEDEVSTSIDDINKRPIADKTAVFGPYDKRILTEISAYPEDSVVIAGRCSYDILARADEVFDREKTFEKLNLDKNKKLILWTTQSHGLTKEENKKAFYAVYNAIKELSDDVQLVIKLHPGEFDLTMHEEIARKVGIKPVIIKHIDIYEILYACDLMLTKDSTTGIETIVLNKPVITINFSGQPDIMPYAESGAALGVYKESDLIINIKKALYNKETQEKLKKAREKFVYEHAYKQDGKATERVCDLIEEMIKESKK